MQAKLLRVLETGEIRRVGDNHTFDVDVRVVCATHRDLEKMVAEGDFREDLLFRINTFEIRIPPLRERPEDLPELVQHLLRRFRPSAKPDDELIQAEALKVLEGHAWPGNVRELANVVEHAAILCDQLPIAAAHLPNRFAQRRPGKPHVLAFPAKTLRELEMEAIHQALQRHAGNKPKAAEELGISLKTLYNKLNEAKQLEQSA
jgi:two-component system NtrC family response regulator